MEGSSVARYAGSTQRDLVGLGTGAQWRELPRNIRRTNLPPRFQRWVREANWKRSCVCSRSNCTRAGNWNWRRVLSTPPSRGQKRGPCGRAHQARQGTKILAICTDHSLPLAVGIQSASPHESQLVEEVLGQSFLDELPERLIGDAAYDSDPWMPICWKPTISS